MNDRVDHVLEKTRCNVMGDAGLAKSELNRCLKELGKHSMVPAQRALAALLMAHGRGHPHASWSFIHQEIQRQACRT